MNNSAVAGGIVAAITLLAGYHVVYVPKRDEVRVIRAQLAEKRSAQPTQADAAALLQQIERYRTRLPQAPDTSWLVKEAVALAEASGVQLTSITQEPPQQVEPFTRLAVSLQFNASYHELGGLLDRLERSDHFIRVERLRLAVRRDATGSSGLSDVPPAVELTCSTLYVPPPSPTPTGEGS